MNLFIYIGSIIKSRIPFESRKAVEEDIEEVIRHLRELVSVCSRESLLL